MVKEYTAYRGDDLIVSGSLLEVARFLGIKKTSVTFMASPTYHKRRKGSQRALLVYIMEV